MSATAVLLLLAEVTLVLPPSKARSSVHIETAPKIGMLMLGSATGGWREQGFWDRGREEWWSVNTHYTDAHGEPLEPTHWMLLPEPPVGS